MWDRISRATGEDWRAAGAVSVHDAGWVRLVYAHNGSWLLLSRQMLTLGYMRNAWWSVDGESIDEAVVTLIVEQCPARLTAIVGVLVRVVEARMKGDER